MITGTEVTIPLDFGAKEKSKRMPDLFKISKIYGYGYGNVDELVFAWGHYHGQLIGTNDTKLQKLELLKNLAFWDGALFILHNEIKDKEELFKRIEKTIVEQRESLDQSREEAKTKKKGKVDSSYMG